MEWNGMEWNIEFWPKAKHWDPLGHSAPAKNFMVLATEKLSANIPDKVEL